MMTSAPICNFSAFTENLERISNYDFSDPDDDETGAANTSFASNATTLANDLLERSYDERCISDNAFGLSNLHDGTCTTPLNESLETSLVAKLIASKRKNAIIGNLLQEALMLGYQVEIKYRATKQSKKGPARDAETIQIYASQVTARCTWGQHTDCSVSERAIVNVVGKVVTLRSYCEVSKERNYDYLYDENGKHILNSKVSYPSHLASISNEIPHQNSSKDTHLLLLVEMSRRMLAYI
jgi:hypothetical protein